MVAPGSLNNWYNSVNGPAYTTTQSGFLYGFLYSLTLAACAAPSSLNLATATLISTPSPTATATPVPLAVSVNGEGIPMPEFEGRIGRYQQAQTALGNTVNLETAKKAITDEFINILLLVQGAAANGYRVDDAAVQSRIDNLAAQVGGVDALKSLANFPRIY